MMLSDRRVKIAFNFGSPVAYPSSLYIIRVSSSFMSYFTVFIGAMNLGDNFYGHHHFATLHTRAVASSNETNK